MIKYYYNGKVYFIKVKVWFTEIRPNKKQYFIKIQLFTVHLSMLKNTTLDFYKCISKC